ncbi:hypothetical protein P7C70_g7023, partial [Phenoliferia sp. Uapishka_3]
MPSSDVKPSRAAMLAALNTYHVKPNLSEVVRKLDSNKDIKPFDQASEDAKPLRETLKRRSESFAVIVITKRFRECAPSPRIKTEELTGNPQVLKPELSPTPQELEAPVLRYGELDAEPRSDYVYDAERQWPVREIVDEDATYMYVDFKSTLATKAESVFWSDSVASKRLQKDGRFRVKWKVGAVLKKDVGVGLKAEWGA